MMATDDILDLRSTEGYVEVYPISTRGLLASIQITSSNATENVVWPPIDSEPFIQFVAYASSGITNGSVQYEQLSGGTQQWSRNWYDDSRSVTAGSWDRGTWGNTGEKNWEMWQPVIYFNMDDLPSGNQLKIELIMPMGHLIEDWDGVPAPLGNAVAEYHDTFDTYVEGWEVTFEDFNGVVPAPATSVFEPIPMDSIPSIWDGYGTVTVELDDDGGFLGGLRGIRFFLDVFHPPLITDEGQPPTQGEYTINTDYNYFDANIGSGLAIAGERLPRLRIWYDELPDVLTVEVEFELGLGMEVLELNVEEPAIEEEEITLEGEAWLTMGATGFQVDALLTSDMTLPVRLHRAKRDRMN